MIRALAFAVVALLACTFPSAGTSAISWGVGLGQWSGAVETGYDRSSQTTRSSVASSEGSTQRLRESLRVANRGFYLLDPRLLTGGLGLTLNLNQSSSQGAGGGRLSSQGIGYSFDATALAEKPYTASVYANRDQTQTTQFFGGRTEGSFENRGLQLRLTQDSILKDWGYPWFSADLRLRNEHHRDTTTVFDRSFERDETRRTIEFNASKGYETADLNLRYQSNDQSNELLPQAHYRTRSGGLGYSIDFGPGRNRHFNSTVDYTTTSGITEIKSLTANGSVHIDHYRNFATDYSLGYNRQESGGFIGVRQDGSFGFTHQLYANLTTSASVNGSHFTVPGGTLNQYAGQLNQRYVHRVPGDGLLSLTWNGGYRLNNNQLGASTIQVNGERHVAPAGPFGPGIGFFLDQLFPIAASIVVVNATRSLPTTVGVDYNVVAEGGRIRIEPIFGSLNIFPGESLDVSYDYQVDPSLKYETRTAGFGGGVDYRWIAVLFQHQQSDQTPLGGGEGRFLTSNRTDFGRVSLRGTAWGIPGEVNASHTRTRDIQFSDNIRDAKTEFEVRGSWRQFDGQGSVALDHYVGTALAFDRRTLNAILTWRVRNNLDAVFSANANDANYATPSRKDATRSVRGSVNWREGRWINTAFGELRTQSGTGVASVTVFQAGGRTRFTYGKLSLSSGVSFDKAVRGGSSSDFMHFDVSLVRVF